MENLTIKIKQTQEVLTELTLPKYFTHRRFYHYKMISEKAYMVVVNYAENLETIAALELYPSIRIEPVRNFSWQNIKAEDINEITQQDFESSLNECKKLMDNL